jgi:membrane protein implicated in regulation of membrane protease activity
MRVMKNPTRVEQSRKMAAMVFASGLGLVSSAAEAYVGPGAGITMLGALWAVLLAVVLALSGLLIWPIRALRRRYARRKPAGDSRADRATQES